MILILVLLSSSSALGQEDTKRRFNELAVQAMHDGDYEKAVQLLQSSLTLGDLNMSYLNLGRAMYKLGRCQDSLAAFDQVMTATQVDSPSPDEVALVLEKWRGEAEEACHASLVFECSEGVTFRLDEGMDRPCLDGPVEVVAGEHSLVATVSGETSERTVSVEPGGSTIVSLLSDGPPSDAPPTDDSGGSIIGLVGWITGGTGLAMLATALVLDLAMVGPALDEYEDAAGEDAARAADLKDSLVTKQNATIGLAIAGGVVALTGATLVIIDLVRSPEAADEPAVGMWLAPDVAGLSFTARW